MILNTGEAVSINQKFHRLGSKKSPSAACRRVFSLTEQNFSAKVIIKLM